jgi:hypothetical protein
VILKSFQREQPYSVSLKLTTSGFFAMKECSATSTNLAIFLFQWLTPIVEKKHGIRLIEREEW